MKLVYDCLIFIGLALQAAVIQSLVRGPYRRLPVLFGYSITLLFATVVDATAYFNGPAFRREFLAYYWIDEVIIQAFLFALVLSFIYKALALDQRRRAIMAALIGAAVVVGAASAWGNYDPAAPASLWMTLISRNLAFFAAILNFILWMVLMRARSASPQLLIISGGLGIESSGEAIAQSIRPLLTPATIWIANLFMILTHLACLAIWWYALRRVSSYPARQVMRQTTGPSRQA